ncbi:MAG: class I SAM-dependent methyltransferase [Cytophagaceae bacterium]
MLKIDLPGLALLDYFTGNDDVSLKLHNTYGEPEDMPVEVYFRSKEDFNSLELMALENSKGRILDIGAGAGSFTIELENAGLDVTALEISPSCCQIMERMGVQNILETDIWDYSDEKYDTLLLMMNGIGLAGSLEKLPDFLLKMKGLLNKEGKIIFDSSDISYLYEGIDKPKETYYGEIGYCFEYQEQMGEWFQWLYVDENTLQEICTSVGLKMNILHKNEFDQYLAELKMI